MIHKFISNSVAHRKIYYKAIVNQQKHFGSDFIVLRLRKVDNQVDEYSKAFGISRTVKSTYNLVADYQEVKRVRLLLTSFSELRNIYNIPISGKVYYDTSFKLLIGDILKGKINEGITVHYVVEEPILSIDDSIFEYTLKAVDSNTDA